MKEEENMKWNCRMKVNNERLVLNKKENKKMGLVNWYSVKVK